MRNWKLSKIKIRGVNIKNTVKFLAVMAAVFLLVFLFVLLMPYFAPLIVAFIISSILEPLVMQIIKRIRIKRKYAVPTAIVLILGMIFWGIWAIVVKLVKEFNGLISSLPNILDTVNVNIMKISESAEAFGDWFPIQIDFNIDQIISNLVVWISGHAQNLAQGLVVNVVHVATNLPQVVMFVVALMLSTFFLLAHKDKNQQFIQKNIPMKWISGLETLKNKMFFALFGYIKAQFIIMGITFVELSVGLTILRVRYALIIAFLTAFLDALPVLGSSMVMIPWGIYNLFIGNYFLGFGLLILFGICTSVRHVIEPKIVSSSIGVNPLLTVTAMYIGIKVIGAIGLIIGPITIILLRTFIVSIMNGQTFKEYFLIEDEL